MSKTLNPGDNPEIPMPQCYYCEYSGEVKKADFHVYEHPTGQVMMNEEIVNYFGVVLCPHCNAQYVFVLSVWQARNLLMNGASHFFVVGGITVPGPTPPKHCKGAITDDEHLDFKSAIENAAPEAIWEELLA